MRPVKNPHFIEEYNRNSASLPLAHISTQFHKQCFNVAPLDIGTNGARKNDIQCLLVLPLHDLIVPQKSTNQQNQQLIYSQPPFKMTFIVNFTFQLVNKHGAQAAGVAKALQFAVYQFAIVDGDAANEKQYAGK